MLFNEKQIRHSVGVLATRPWRQTGPLWGEWHVIVLCSDPRLWELPSYLPLLEERNAGVLL